MSDERRPDTEPNGRPGDAQEHAQEHGQQSESAGWTAAPPPAAPAGATSAGAAPGGGGPIAGAPAGGAPAGAWPAAPVQQPGRSKALRIVIPIVSVLVAVLVAVGVRAAINAVSQPSPSEIASQAVQQVKKSSTLPVQVDGVTTWTGISSSGDEIRYSYRIDQSVQPADVTKEALRQSVSKSICAKDESRKLLDADVVMRYSYRFASTGDTIGFSLTKADCG